MRLLCPDEGVRACNLRMEEQLTELGGNLADQARPPSCAANKLLSVSVAVRHALLHVRYDQQQRTAQRFDLDGSHVEPLKRRKDEVRPVRPPFPSSLWPFNLTCLSYLEENLTPEWKRAYIDYRACKKAIKVIARRLGQAKDGASGEDEGHSSADEDHGPSAQPKSPSTVLASKSPRFPFPQSGRLGGLKSPKSGPELTGPPVRCWRLDHGKEKLMGVVESGEEGRLWRHNYNILSPTHILLQLSASAARYRRIELRRPAGRSCAQSNQ